MLLSADLAHVCNNRSFHFYEVRLQSEHVVSLSMHPLRGPARFGDRGTELSTGYLCATDMAFSIMREKVNSDDVVTWLRHSEVCTADNSWDETKKLKFLPALHTFFILSMRDRRIRIPILVKVRLNLCVQLLTVISSTRISNYRHCAEMKISPYSYGISRLVCAKLIQHSTMMPVLLCSPVNL